MAKKIVISMVAVLVSIAAYAQNSSDSIVTLFDDLRVPLVEKKYVANTNLWFPTSVVMIHIQASSA